MPFPIADHNEAHSFAAVGFHLCNNELSSSALTVDSLYVGWISRLFSVFLFSCHTQAGLIFPRSAFISVSTAAKCALTRALIGKGFGVSIV